VTTPETGVVITLGQIYDELRDTAKTVNRVDSTLTAFRDEVAARLDDHETRIRVDEANRWPRGTLALYATVAAGIGGVGTLFLTR
jgi:hypothetical protein